MSKSKSKSYTYVDGFLLIPKYRVAERYRYIGEEDDSRLIRDSWIVDKSTGKSISFKEYGRRMGYPRMPNTRGDWPLHRKWLTKMDAVTARLMRKHFRRR